MPAELLMRHFSMRAHTLYTQTLGVFSRRCVFRAAMRFPPFAICPARRWFTRTLMLFSSFFYFPH